MKIRVTRTAPGMWGIYGLKDDSHLGDLIDRGGTLEFQTAIQGRPPDPEETKTIKAIRPEELPGN